MKRLVLISNHLVRSGFCIFSHSLDPPIFDIYQALGGYDVIFQVTSWRP